MGAIETATKYMECVANDDSHGYDQNDRWGNPNFDCSGLVITAWEIAGVKVKSKGATYTGNMLSAFKKCGFNDITNSVDLNNGNGLQRGDVLLSVGNHVAMYCGNGKEVEASINEKGTVTGGKSGDQTGKEILIRSYRNYPWTNVLRYSKDTVNTTNTKTNTIDYADHKDDSIAGRYKVTTSLYLRCGAGTHKKAIAILSKGQIVSNYGYYSYNGNTKWLYISATIDGVKYVGFSSSKYLSKM